MGQRKFDFDVDQAYISKNGWLTFLITEMENGYLYFRSFNRNDGSYKDSKKWLEKTFRDSVEREATPGEKSLLDLEVAREGEKEMVARRERRSEEYLANVSTPDLLLEFRRRDLIKEILFSFVTDEEWLAAARRRGYDLIKKDD